uniref:Uncharacterized protein n=1 Tax=Eutreptiella gymnastica TaxID=73025 RepID=A0A7S1N7S7_9EUGL|mmetsp:Transcript_131252/g.227196  ORF Transcript_131252/g.227196 Transcript_131252/m.227196 type:complete len:145 (+) Transcript_131252:201-635(+)
MFTPAWDTPLNQKVMAEVYQGLPPYGGAKRPSHANPASYHATQPQLGCPTVPPHSSTTQIPPGFRNTALQWRTEQPDLGAAQPALVMEAGLSPKMPTHSDVPYSWAMQRERHHAPAHEPAPNQTHRTPTSYPWTTTIIGHGTIL